jgi:hypothetical protein
MRVWWLLACLAGCDQLLGLVSTGSSTADAPARDAPARDALVPDGFRLVVPPDGGTTCPAPIDLSSWTFAPTPVPAPAASYALAVYSVMTETNMMVVGADANDVWHVYEWDLASTLTPIPALDQPVGTRYTSIGVNPTGDVAWLGLDGGSAGLYLAAAASGWTPQPVSLGALGAGAQVGSIGFYDGTARMVVAINPGGSDPHLAELSSPDGLSWTPVAGSFGAAFDGLFEGTNTPALTPDGCVVVFSGVTATFDFEVYVASRGSDGTFGAPIAFVAANSASPALSADRTTAWYVSTTSGDQLMQGHP